MVTKDETYNFFFYQFRVYDLYKWAEKNLETISVGLDSIAKSYGFETKKGFISMFRLDKDYAQNLSQKDVAQPLLLVDLGECGQLMIDGTHRSFNLWKKGEKKAPAYYIKDESIIIKFSNVTKKMFKKMNEN